MIALDKRQVLLLHSLLAEQTGGDDGIRDVGLLESALLSPFQTFDGQPLYPTLKEKAARLCCSIISNHPFVDGNKRTGLLVLLTFLSLNGMPLCPSCDSLVKTGLSLAASQMSYQELCRWIEENKG